MARYELSGRMVVWWTLSHLMPDVIERQGYLGRPSEPAEPEKVPA
jgi:hypothetical protein